MPCGNVGLLYGRVGQLCGNVGRPRVKLLQNPWTHPEACIAFHQETR